MPLVDWRELYASNQAAIARAHGHAGASPSAPSSLSLQLPALLPGGGRAAGTDERSLTVAGRARRVLVHEPPGLEPGVAVPLVCMLHGCTQDAAGFAAATRMNQTADRYKFIAVYPQQERADNQQGCWNWFQPKHQE